MTQWIPARKVNVLALMGAVSVAENRYWAIMNTKMVKGDAKEAALVERLLPSADALLKKLRQDFNTENFLQMAPKILAWQEDNDDIRELDRIIADDSSEGSENAQVRVLSPRTVGLYALVMSIYEIWQVFEY